MLHNELFQKLEFQENWDSEKDSNLPEPLLIPNSRRFVLFPIQYSNIWSVYKDAEAHFWTAEEIDLYDDAQGLTRLSGKEKAFLQQAAALLSQNNSNIIQKLASEIQIPEARCFFGFEMMRRNIHNEFWNVLMDMYGASEPSYIQDLAKELTAMDKRHAWIEAHLTESNESFGSRMMAYAIFTSLSLKSVETMLLFMVNPEHDPVTSILPGLLSGIVKWIQDRQNVFRFCKLIIGLLANKIGKQYVHLMVSQIVSIESELVAEILNMSGNHLSLQGKLVSYEDVTKHLQSSANSLLIELGYDTMYPLNASPLAWISTILLAFARNNENKLQQSKPQATPMIQNEDVPLVLDAEF